MREVKYCCFRFDVDTHACVRRGMPPLLELGESLEVKFTFFVNMGRAFDRRITLAKAFRRFRGGADGPVSHIPASSKLGKYDSAIAAVFNPRAGLIDPAILRRARQLGHEIGVHGGRNHAQWEHFAHTWTPEKVRDEINFTLDAMRKNGIRDTTSFASPAWNSPACLKELLPFLGFDILADTYDSRSTDISDLGPIHSVPTNITPATGRAGYIETMRMAGKSRRAMIDDFRGQLERKGRLAVVYDHPFFAGTHAISETRDLVAAALESGFVVTTVKEAVRNLKTAQLETQGIRS